MKKFILFFALISSSLIWAQGYKFTDQIDLKTTEVLSQGQTGTCWSFSTSSFLESEIMRIKGEEIDLSEMYNVRFTYPAKAENYLMRQGKAQFSEGGLAHDVINSVSRYGLVPQSAYSGLKGESNHNHQKMMKALEKTVEHYNERPNGVLNPKWRADVDSILDYYLGAVPDKFEYNGTEYTPTSFLEYTGIQPAEYITVTSFSHQPYYSSFILNIPDNFSNGSMYNVPLDDFMNTLNHALKNGYTVELDCDVSEPTFSAGAGVAVIPAETEDAKKSLKQIVPEVEVSQEYRQLLFENQLTTDDHLMHIVGTATDQDGNLYYKVKNSWGKGSRVNYGGYIYMSVAYMRLKAISIMIHKDAMPEEIKKDIN